MLYLYHGTDYQKKHQAVQSCLQNLQEKKEELLVFRLEGDEFSEEQLQSYLGSVSLFAQVPVVIITHSLGQKESQKLFANYAQEMQQAPQHFIFIEETIPKSLVTKAKNVSAICQGFLSENKETKPFQIFRVTDALGERDRKELWFCYRQAINEGIDPQEILSIIIWQMKTLLIVEEHPQQTNLKPFVVQKAKRFLKNYSSYELHHLLHEFTTLYHEARRQKPDLELALEKALLRV